MVSAIILCTFFSFYMLYNSSKRAIKYRGFGFENWMNSHTTFTKLFAMFLGVCALVAAIFIFGIGGGVLLFGMVLMTLGSVVVLLTPLQLVTYKSVFLLFFSALFIEFFVL